MPHIIDMKILVFYVLSIVCLPNFHFNGDLKETYVMDMSIS